mmetsp:Transcript_39565/g.118739  ORF Transcript_39565/g.118739 Transcript_39565/m.118739 type:complete len:324 (-) Transcript_39565:779-1750(-)
MGGRLNSSCSAVRGPYVCRSASTSRTVRVTSGSGPQFRGKDAGAIEEEGAGPEAEAEDDGGGPVIAAAAEDLTGIAPGPETDLALLPEAADGWDCFALPPPIPARCNEASTDDFAMPTLEAPEWCCCAAFFAAAVFAAAAAMTAAATFLAAAADTGANTVAAPDFLVLPATEATGNLAVGRDFDAGPEVEREDDECAAFFCIFFSFATAPAATFVADGATTVCPSCDAFLAATAAFAAAVAAPPLSPTAALAADVAAATNDRGAAPDVWGMDTCTRGEPTTAARTTPPGPTIVSFPACLAVPPAPPPEPTTVGPVTTIGARVI